MAIIIYPRLKKDCLMSMFDIINGDNVLLGAIIIYTREPEHRQLHRELLLDSNTITISDDEDGSSAPSDSDSSSLESEDNDEDVDHFIAPPRCASCTPCVFLPCSLYIYCIF